MYSEYHPHPDLKYITTVGKTVWYQCTRCKRHMHSLKYFGWLCPNCNNDIQQRENTIVDGLDY